MAHERDYENINNIDQLDDRELRDLVREQLSAHTALDIDDITVTVAQGTVTLAGRIGTDGEKRVAEHVLTDVLGITEFRNELVIDPLRRAESPLDIDEHLADEERRAGTLLGDVAVSLSDESGHLADSAREDLEGTSDYQQVMEDGMTWNPPDLPTPEGMSGSDARPEEMGGQH
ncbi:MAG TPA: BON domain-containing protein [Gemmatimonadaceae bacterium]|nr:BON domain-containing protein [Gemmatimonadaceae bacterium]